MADYFFLHKVNSGFEKSDESRFLHHYIVGTCSNSVFLSIAQIFSLSLSLLALVSVVLLWNS